MAPRDVVPGRNYGAEIMDALESVVALVLVLSANSNNSKHVSKEVERAVSRGKAIFPVRIRDVQPSGALELFTAGLQWVDAWVPPIEHKIDHLAGAIHALTGGPSAVSEPERKDTGPSGSPPIKSAIKLSGKQMAAIAAAVVIGVVAFLWQAKRGNQPGSIKIPPTSTSPQNAGGPLSPDSLARLEKLKSTLSDQIDHRNFDDAASTITSLLEIDRDNREAIEAQTLIDRLKGTFTREFDVPGNVVSAIFLQEGNRVLAACSGIVGTSASAHPESFISWNVNTGQKLFDTPITGAAFRANSVSFTPDGKTALTGGYFGLNLYNVETGQRSSHFDAGIVTCVAMLSGGTRALAGGSELALWDLELNTVVRRFEGHTDRVQSLALTPDQKRAVSAAADSTVRLWDLSKSSAIWSVQGPKVNFQSLAITPDAKYILSGGDGVIVVHELDTGREVTSLKAHKGYTLSLAISPDGTRALSGGTDNIVRLWDLATARQVRAYRVKNEWTGSLGFSQDGRRALIGTIDGGGLQVVSLPD
jgi:hypothetical protein